MASTTQHVPDLLRIATAGSVDDGKSTLVGRLLYLSLIHISEPTRQVR